MATIGDITTRTALNAYLKVLQKKLTKQFSDATVLYSAVKKRTGREVAGGREVELPMHIWPNRQIAGTRGDAGSWSKGSVGKRAYAKVEVYNHNTTGSFGRLAELKTKQDMQSLQSVVEATVEDIRIGFPMALNKLLFLDGTGILARVSSTTLGTLKFKVHAELGANSGSTWGTRYLEEGMWFNATDDKTDTDPIRTVDAQIIDVNTGTREFTCEGNLAGLVADDYIVLQDGLNRVTNGLCGGIGDGTTAPDFGATYLNILRTGAGNSYWQGDVKSSLGAASIEEEIILALTRVQKGIGKAPKMAICPFEVYNQIFIQAKSDTSRQFVVSVGKKGTSYAMGFDSVSVSTPHGAIEIYGERDCPTQTMFLIDPSDWVFAQVNEPGWYKDSNGSMYHDVGGTYGVSVNYHWVMNFVCRTPRGQSRLNELPQAT